MTQDKNHIGDLIKKTLEEDGRSAIWLAEKIHCKRRNVYNIYNRASINTAQLLRISLALKTDFFVYFSEIYEKMIDKTKYVSSEICNVMPQDEFRIGSLIKNKLDEDGRSVKWLAQMIHCKRSNVYDILNNRASIDTARLLKICLVLKMNFFEYFSDLYKISILNGQYRN